MKMKIEIDDETADGIVLGALKRQLKCLQNPKFPSRQPDDIEFEKKLIAAHKMLVRYYGKP